MKRFTLTHDHLRLLRAAYVGWNDCEYGAPEIDPKRPYGNSDVEGDIARILAWVLFKDADGDLHFTREQQDRASQLHRETQDALSIVIDLGEVPLGNYAHDRDVGWFVVDDESSAAETLRQLHRLRGDS
ncbi:MAG TPA: hypothetical protein VK611_24965 [Acidimicrobiales bacterium]|nr:hypothetical protein [Acidimicrobiales bacterium]